MLVREDYNAQRALDRVGENIPTGMMLGWEIRVESQKSIEELPKLNYQDKIPQSNLHQKKEGWKTRRWEENPNIAYTPLSDLIIKAWQ